MPYRKILAGCVGVGMLFAALPSTSNVQAQANACAASLSGETAQDYLARGQQYALDTPCALADLSKAIELDANLVEAYVARAQIYIETEAYDLALGDLDSALQLDPENVTALALRGRVYAGPNAVDTLGGPFIQLFLGYINYGDDYLSAINDLDQAMGLDPANLDANLAYGDFYAINSDYESAVGQYSIAIDLAPDDPRGYYKRGFADLKIARANSSDRILPQNVLDDFEQVIALNPDSPYAIYVNSLILEYSGDFEGAVNEFDRGTQLYPNFAPLHYRMAYTVTAMNVGRIAPPLPPGTNERALEAIARAVELAPYSNLYLVRQSFMVTSLDIDYALALANLNQVLEVSPDFPPALLNLAGLYTFSQLYQDCTQAADYLDEVLFIYSPDRVREVQEFRDFEATYQQRCIHTDGPDMVDVSSPLYPAGSNYTLGIRPLMLENVPGNPSGMVVCSPATDSTIVRTAQNPDDGLTYVFLQCDGGEGWILESLLR